MDSPLRETLKHLCSGTAGWSYAIFWKFVSHSPMLLARQASYWRASGSLGPPDVSRCFQAQLVNGGDDVLDKLENCCQQPGCQLQDYVTAHTNTAFGEQFHVIGDGVVWRAALTGLHQWIVKGSHLISHFAQDDNMRHSFSEGIQTITVIPVIPYGVIHLGSANMIAENVGFVEKVKCLILQVMMQINECKMAPEDKTPFLHSHDISLFDGAMITPSQVSGSTPVTADGCEQQAPPTRHANQASCALFTVADDRNTIAILPKSNSNPSLSVHGRSCYSICIDNPLSGQATDGAVKAEVFWPKPGPCMNKQVSYNGSFSSTSTLPLSKIPIFGPSGGANENSSKLNASSPLPEKGKMHNTGNSYETINSNCYGKWKQVGGDSYPLPVQGAGSEFSGLPDLGTYLLYNTSSMSSSEHNIDNDRFQASGFSLAQGHWPTWMGELSSLGHDYWANNAEPIEIIDRSQDVLYEAKTALRTSIKNLVDVCASNEGDLFDALGNGVKLNDVDFDGNENNGSISKDYSFCINQMIKCHKKPFSNTLREESALRSLNFSVSEADHLLDAVVSNINPHRNKYSDDCLSCKTDLTGVSSSSFFDNSSNCSLTFSEQTVCRNSTILPSAFQKPETSKLVSLKLSHESETERNCQTNGTFSQNYGYNEDDENMNHDSIITGLLKRPIETAKLSRKRPRFGESLKARPKDRQLIQDRFKDLRELVPNATKCSIDTLLERTIKHILFLQSVTKHAEKLKQVGNVKVTEKEANLLLRNRFEGGITWAFEVGSSSMICPILVENLTGPRQMLIEMLCEERGFFLEIADIIKDLGLTIMEGVMEFRKGTIWAHFAVEAKTDISRMDVFMSLVRVLEQPTDDLNQFNMASTESSITVTTALDEKLQ